MDVLQLDDAWQCDKSVLQCNRYMLEHEIATDVTFLVGTEEGKRRHIKAHKYVLCSRSPVFFAMFHGLMAQTDGGVVVIPDIDPKAFEEVLRYLYYEKSYPEPDVIGQVLYAAKKYLISSLAKRCAAKYKSLLTADNVCAILDQSIMFGETNIVEGCLQFISTNTAEVMECEDFKALSHEALCKVVELKELTVDEVTVYEHCLQWADTAVTKEHPADCPMVPAGSTTVDGEGIRKLLGNALYQIRFPLIPLNYFNDKIVPHKILSSEETVALYQYYTATNKPNLPFPEHRTKIWQRHRVRRFNEMNGSLTAFGWKVGSNPDVIDICSSKDVQLRGFGVYQGKEAEDRQCSIIILEAGGEGIYYREKRRIFDNGTAGILQVSLSKPVFMKANGWYTVAILLSGSQTSYGQSTKVKIVQESGVTFKFRATKSSYFSNNINATNTKRGQLPEFLFEI